MPIPDGVPDGWEEYTDWSCDCRFYVPSAAEHLPSPVAWEACPSAPNGESCEAMVVDWSTATTPIAVTARTYMFESKPHLNLQRNIVAGGRTAFMHIHAEADGPVRSAVMRVAPPEEVASAPGCWLLNADAHEGTFLLKARGDNAMGPESNIQGLLVGRLDELRPTVLVQYDNTAQFSDGWSGGSSWIARGTPASELLAHSWELAPPILVTTPAADPENMRPGFLSVQGSGIFWHTIDNYRMGTNVWDPVSGARPFIRYVGDATRGATNLGTDGVDMMWTEGEGKLPTETHASYTARHIMTSPFTTDPSAVVPRRLRSDPSVGTIQFYQVACGHGAHGGGTQPTIVVRISDGWSWVMAPTSSSSDYYIDSVVGMSCEHVYVLGKFGPQWRLARIRLDSLGPGEAPD